MVDLWHAANGHEHPATHFNGSSYAHNHTQHAPAVHGHVSDYEEYKFGQRVVSIIKRWADDPSEAKRPLFINYDSHVAHEPLHVPQVSNEVFHRVSCTSRTTNKSCLNRYTTINLSS